MKTKPPKIHPGVTVALAGLLALTGPAILMAQAQQQDSAAQQGQGQGQGHGQNRGEGWGGGMRGMGGGRGIVGTVTEVAGDHYTVKTETGELYTVHYSVNTRIMKEPPGQGRGPGQAGQGRARSDDADRPQPQPLKPTDIKAGDVITAGGEVDAAAKSVGAVFILQIDPERAREMRAMQANFGKTWLAGRITGIDGTTITIEGMLDHAPHAVAVDENTSFHKRRDAITLADIKAGDQLRAEGAMKDGVFLATVVNAMNPPNPEGAGRGAGAAAGGPPGSGAAAQPK